MNLERIFEKIYRETNNISDLSKEAREAEDKFADEIFNLLKHTCKNYSNIISRDQMIRGLESSVGLLKTILNLDRTKY